MSVIGDFTLGGVPDRPFAPRSRRSSPGWRTAPPSILRRRSRCTSAGSSRYAAGVRVSKPRVMGHRDLALTACPGDLAYPQLPSIRSSAASQWSSAQYVGRAARFTPITARRFLDTRIGTRRAPRRRRPGSHHHDPTVRAAGGRLGGDGQPHRDVGVHVDGGGGLPGRADAHAATSALNTGTGRTTAATVTVGVGSDGAITLRNSAGTVHLIADLAGLLLGGFDGGPRWQLPSPGRHAHRHRPPGRQGRSRAARHAHHRRTAHRHPGRQPHSHGDARRGGRLHHGVCRRLGTTLDVQPQLRGGSQRRQPRHGAGRGRWLGDPLRHGCDRCRDRPRRSVRERHRVAVHPGQPPAGARHPLRVVGAVRTAGGRRRARRHRGRRALRCDGGGSLALGDSGDACRRP